MRRLIILLFLFFCGIGATAGYFYWPKVQHALKKNYRPSSAEEASDQKKVEELLNESKTEEALQIIKNYENFISPNTPEGRKWIQLLITASEKTRNVQQLVVLYDYFPDAFEGHEDGVLLIGQAYLANGRTKDFEQVREKWKGKETQKPKWVLLDSEKLIVDGKQKDAMELLKSQTFQGSDETSRLLHLAWLSVTEDPKKAWEYLTEAHTKDPTNPYIRVYRARLLEAASKTALALSEYIAAVQTAPDNIALKDQVGEFFRRYHQYYQATKIWTESLNKSPESEFLWLKAWFWSRVAAPVPKFDWATALPPSGPIQSLLDYLVNLSPDQFWDASAFEKVPNNNNILRSQQATFWLRLIENLKQKKEKEALELLKFNAFEKVSWDPDLEAALKSVLTYRSNGSFATETVQPQQENADKTVPKTPESLVNVKPIFFNQLTELSTQTKTDASKPVEVPADLKELLSSDEAFAATFLAAGWVETALQLHQMPIIPAGFPDWVSYGFTQAIRLNRGVQEALEFATKQKQTPMLSLLESELLIASGSPDAGLEKLQTLSLDETDVGLRAAWIISLLYIDKKEFVKSRDTINAHPKLAQSLVGRETLARIALLEGNEQLANSLYLALEKESSEAKSYLARKAFAEKDWKRAHELTEQLLMDFPTNTLVRQNLEKVIQEEQKEKQGLSTPVLNPPKEAENPQTSSAPK